jgi:hypothetical protein
MISGLTRPSCRYHLESLIYGSIAIPMGLIVYGWTAEKVLPSVVPIVATGFVGFGVMFTFVSIMESQTAVGV